MKYLRFLTIIVSLCMISCESELDILPQQSIAEGPATATPDNIEAILIGAYDTAGGDANGLLDDGNYDGDLANISVLFGNTDQVDWNGTFANLRDVYFKQMVNNNTGATTAYGNFF